jgi:hypothetical protein
MNEARVIRVFLLHNSQQVVLIFKKDHCQLNAVLSKESLPFA